MAGVYRQDEVPARDSGGAGEPDRVPSVRRKVGLLVAVFVVLLAAQVVLSALLMDSLWAISAYRRGLGEWSQQRQAAVDALLDFLESGSAEARRRLDRSFEALAGFESARLALAGDGVRSASKAVQGLVRGGLAQDEATALVRFESHVRVFPGGAELNDAWRRADVQIARLRAMTDRVEQVRSGGAAASLPVNRLRRSIRQVDADLEAIESHFSDILAHSQATLRNRLHLQQVVGSSVLLALAIGFGVWTSRRLERDAAERRRAEHALRRNQERLREVVEHSTNLFYSHTTDHQLTYVSPQTRAFFDCEPEEALTHWTDFVTDHPINQRGMALTERAIATGKRQPVYELELRGARGRKIWVEVNEAPMVRDGQTVGVVGALTDVTERKRAEEERERLKERVASRRSSSRRRPAGRRRGPRLQQPADGDPRLHRPAAPSVSARTTTSARAEPAEIRRRGRARRALTSQLLAFSRRQVASAQSSTCAGWCEDSTRMIASPDPARTSISKRRLGRRTSARQGRPGSGRTAHGQPGGQRPRRHARRRPPVDRHANIHLETGGAAGTCRRAGGRLRPARGERHRRTAWTRRP